MTLPGAETMKGGIIGVDCFLSSGTRSWALIEPLIFVFAISSLIPLTARLPLGRGGISKGGEVEGLVSDGVSICCRDVVLELDRECDLVLRGFPPNDFLGLLVIAQLACSLTCKPTRFKNE